MKMTSTDYMSHLNYQFSQLTQEYNKLQLLSHSKQTRKKCKQFLTNGTRLYNHIKMHLNSLEALLSDCEEYLQEIDDDLSATLPKEDYVYETSNGMLSYLGRDHIVKDTKKINKATKIPRYEKYYIKEIDYSLNLPIVNQLHDITSMFYYYNNNKDKKNPPGIYCSILPGIYIKVAFPTVVDSTKDSNKTKSVKCKYGTLVACIEQREKMAKYYNSSIRVCNYAHKNEKIIKVSNPSRCIAVPKIGNASTLLSDIKLVNLSDIKHLLLYGLNDIFTAAIWFDYNHITTLTCNNIDYV